MSAVKLVQAYTRQEPYRAVGTPIRRPGVWVELSVGSVRTPPIFAIVDSGADGSMFHTDVAVAMLGIDPLSLPPLISGGTGGKTTVYQCPLTIHYWKRDIRTVVTFNPKIDPTIALLGREDFFQQFHLGFDQRGSRLLLARY